MNGWRLGAAAVAAASVAGLLAAGPAAAPAVGSPQAPATPAASQPVPSFRGGVDVVSLSVTVTDGTGRYVTDLTPQDFLILEDGVTQDVTFFDKTNAPIALSLLLDTSASMEDRMATAQEAAAGFARRLRPRDLGSLVDFDRDVKILQPFTNDREALERAIRTTTAGGSTSLYNAIYISLKELKKARARTEQDIRRQALVVLSDGEDTSSLVTYDEVLDLAKRSETAIYTIGLRTKEELQSRGFNEANFVLRQLATETGGRAFFPALIQDLAGVYSQIADELASQYLIGYTSKNARRDGAWRRLVVRADRPGTTTRTRQGYFGPK